MMDCHASHAAHAQGAHKGESFDKHAGHHGTDFLKKFWIALALMAPIVFWPALPPFATLLLGSAIYFYCGLAFLSGAARELKARLPGMMTLIALAITTAYAWSVYALFSRAGMPLWWELATLIAVMLLGHWVEMRAVKGAQGALHELAKLLPDAADLWEGGETRLVPVAELKVGDVVLVRPGAKVPADGVVIEGSSELNESILTGESRLVPKGAGGEVIAGAVNGDGSLKVRIAKVGEDTFLSGVARLVAEAERSKSRLQALSDRAAYWLTVVAVAAGVLTLVAWLLAGAPAATAVERTVAVLVIACPHALGLAIPLVASISTSMGARHGLLVRRRLALEAARSVDTVLFDKTGTLTQGDFEVSSYSSDEALALAAAVDSHSSHPIGKAIVAKAKAAGLKVPAATAFTRVPGQGGEATVNGKKVFVGHRGGPDIVVEREGREVGRISVGDTLRGESRAAIEGLKREGLKVAMVTGDAQEVASAVASSLALDEYFARVRPEEKAEKVRTLQRGGRKVAMVGDGVNDAPALSQADVGIAIGAGTNVALESAGIILVKSDPRAVASVIRLSRLTYRKMVQNLFWATGYNVLALPLAAGVLVPWGIMLTPAAAAVLMSLSTIIVSVNAALLKRNQI